MPLVYKHKALISLGIAAKTHSYDYLCENVYFAEFNLIWYVVVNVCIHSKGNKMQIPTKKQELKHAKGFSQKYV